MRNYKLMIATGAFLVIALLAGGALAAVSPLEKVKTTGESILEGMQNQELRKPENKQERRARIIAHVDKRFDFEEMSKLTLANKWKERSAVEKKEFEHLFSQLLKNTYIGRIEAYSGEELVYEKEVFDGDRQSRVMVYTKVIKNNQEIPINYKLLKKDSGEWYVYDVLIEGVSLVRNYRTEFARILNRDSYQALIQRLQEKVDGQNEGDS